MGVVGAVAAVAGTAASIGGQIAGGGSSGGGGQSGGFTSGSSPPGVYIPQSQPALDANYAQLVQSMVPYAQAIPGMVVPGLQSAAGNIVNNAYRPQAQGAANAASAYGTGTVFPGAATAASSLYGMAQGAVPYATQILQSGFDPRQALYNRTFQQTMDQQNAINAMYGVSSSPYGAGVAGQTAANFNIDWQNQQLQRQLAATRGYGNLVTDVGRGFAGAADLGTSAMGTLSTAGALPYATSTGMSQNDIQALNALSSGTAGAFGLDANTLNAIAAYLKLGQSATSVGQAGAYQNFARNRQIGYGVGNSLAGLGKLFGTGGGGTGGGGGYPSAGYNTGIGTKYGLFPGSSGGYAGGSPTSYAGYTFGSFH